MPDVLVPWNAYISESLPVVSSWYLISFMYTNKLSRLFNILMWWRRISPNDAGNHAFYGAECSCLTVRERHKQDRTSFHRALVLLNIDFERIKNKDDHGDSDFHLYRVVKISSSWTLVVDVIDLPLLPNLLALSKSLKTLLLLSPLTDIQHQHINYFILETDHALNNIHQLLQLKTHTHKST